MFQNRVFCFFIFAIFLFTACASFKKDLVMCGDCTEENKEKCIIESDSGYYVQPSPFSKSIALRSYSPPPQTADLDVCMPSSMKIDAKDGTFRYICVWSPELGCNVLSPKGEDGFDCSFCRTRDLDDRPTCPCTRPKSGKGKKKNEKSGSKQLYTGSLLVIIAAFSVQHIHQATYLD